MKRPLLKFLSDFRRESFPVGVFRFCFTQKGQSHTNSFLCSHIPRESTLDKNIGTQVEVSEYQRFTET